MITPREFNKVATRDAATATFVKSKKNFRTDWKEFFLFGLSLLLTTMTKPSYTLILVSTAGLVMLYRLFRPAEPRKSGTVYSPLMFFCETQTPPAENLTPKREKTALHTAIIFYGFSMIFLFYKQTGWSGGAPPKPTHLSQTQKRCHAYIPRKS